MDGSVLRAYDMNKFEIQLLHISEENMDKIITDSMSYDSSDNAWEGNNRRIKDITQPTADNDAVNLAYLNSIGVAKQQTVVDAVALVTAAKESAKTSEVNAKTSEVNAKTSEVNAKTSETNAKASETNAKASETNAKASEVASANSATKAKVSETNVDVSEQNMRVLVNSVNPPWNIRISSHAYSGGDVAYSASLPSWARLECVTAGTTAEIAPTMPTSAGVLLTDGGVTWIVDDVRENGCVGDILIRPILRNGFIKANGAVLKASEYPRLLTFAVDNSLTVTAAVYATDCSKYVYDSTADTLQVPNMTGRVLQGGDILKSVEAGLPNITGETGHASNRVAGAFYTISGGGLDWNGANNTFTFFDASRCSPIYGASTTVQPPALQMIPQIKY